MPTDPLPERPPQLSRIRQMALPACLLGALALLLYREPEPVRWLRLKAFDVYNRITPRKPWEDTAIVAIDEESIRRLGQWPWPHPLLGELALTLRYMGAKVVAFDVVFADPDRLAPAGRPADDDVFARQLARAGHVVLAFGSSSQDTGREPASAVAVRHNGGSDPYRLFFSSRYFLTPIPALAAAASSGAALFAAEGDGVVRRVPLLVGQRGRDGAVDQCFPSLPLEAVRLALGAPGYTLDYGGTAGSTRFVRAIRLDATHAIPTDANASLWFYDAGHRPGLYVPAWKVLAGQIGEAAVRDKLVFVGASTEGLMDRAASPLGLPMPGVEFHAQLAEQMLHGQFLVRTARMGAAEAAGTLLLGLGVIALAPRVGVGALAALVGVLLVGLLGGGVWAYRAYGWLLDPVGPALALGAVFLASLVLAHREASRRAQESLFQARHDPLTGLENRAGFTLALGRAVARTQRDPAHAVALLLIDLDGFKAVNDTYGHPAGDAVLQAIADRLRVCQRAGDVVCRLGGDEFAVILEGAAPLVPEVVARKILDSVAAPIALAAATIQVGCSIGIAVFPAAAATPAGLVEQADAALYAAKRGGKNTYRRTPPREDGAGGALPK